MRPLAAGTALAVALSAPFADLLLERHDLARRAGREAARIAGELERRVPAAPAMASALARWQREAWGSPGDEEVARVSVFLPPLAEARWEAPGHAWPTVSGEAPLRIGEASGVVRVTVAEREWLRRDGILLFAFSSLGILLGLGLYFFPLRLLREEDLVRALVGRSLRAAEEERLRLSRELHDGLGQTTSALAVALARAQAEAPSPPLAEASALADLALEEIRRTARALRPPALEDLGLGPAVAALARRLAEEAGLELDLEVGEIPRLPEELELCCYRLCQEGLTNVVRHANARRLTVGLACEGPSLALSIEDDGRGFSPSETLGLGLLGARERIAALGGTLRVATAPGEGTRLRIALPVAAPRAVA